MGTTARQKLLAFKIQSALAQTTEKIKTDNGET